MASFVRSETSGNLCLTKADSLAKLSMEFTRSWRRRGKSKSRNESRGRETGGEKEGEEEEGITW